MPALRPVSGLKAPNTIPLSTRTIPPERLAVRLHGCLTGRRADPLTAAAYPLDCLAEQAEQFLTYRRQLGLCREHRLDLASAKIQRDYRNVLVRLPELAGQALRSWPLADTAMLATPADLAADLRQLHEEFGGYAFDAEKQTLSVTTDAIELEEVYLGPFEIRLELSRLAQQRSGPCYRVIATDPHPAASNEAVTHPHVSESTLCEGEATVPIRQALSQGRLADFFLLVNGVLETYNAGSPYVPLDNWIGTPCHDCGYTSDDLSMCNGCDHDFCNDCISYCRCCDESHCPGCLESCSECQKRTCDKCLAKCPDCGEAVCSDCMDDQRQCPTCRKNDESKSPPTGESDHDDHHTRNAAPGITDGNTTSHADGTNGVGAAPDALPGPEAQAA